MAAPSAWIASVSRRRPATASGRIQICRPSVRSPAETAQYATVVMHSARGRTAVVEVVGDEVVGHQGLRCGRLKGAALSWIRPIKYPKQFQQDCFQTACLVKYFGAA